jgi:TFIIF-interacting CTD phosphatase-like protein
LNTHPILTNFQRNYPQYQKLYKDAKVTFSSIDPKPYPIIAVPDLYFELDKTLILISRKRLKKTYLKLLFCAVDKKAKKKTYIYKRPYLERFLKRLSKKFPLHILSRLEKETIALVVNQLEDLMGK